MNATEAVLKRRPSHQDIYEAQTRFIELIQPWLKMKTRIIEAQTRKIIIKSDGLWPEVVTEYGPGVAEQVKEIDEIILMIGDQVKRMFNL